MAKTVYALLVFTLFFLNVFAQESKYERNKMSQNDTEKAFEVKIPPLNY